METMILGLEKRMDLLSDQRGRREELVSELFKMLKQSMESRMKIVAKYLELKRHFETALSEPNNIPEQAPPQPSPHISSKRIIWPIIAILCIGTGLVAWRIFMMQ